MQSLTKHRERLRAIREAEETPRDPEANKLYNEKTFYNAFTKDMLEAEKEIIIYCPFISKYRSEFFSQTFKELKRRNIDVFIFTRPLEEHEYLMRAEISCALRDYEELGASIFYLNGSIHEKAAIIDRKVLWEGSLNILSQRESREMMRRTENQDFAKQVMRWLGLNKKLAESYKEKYEKLYRELMVEKERRKRINLGVVFTGFLVPIVAWWLFFSAKVIIVSLKGLKVILKLVGL